VPTTSHTSRLTNVAGALGTSRRVRNVASLDVQEQPCDRLWLYAIVAMGRWAPVTQGWPMWLLVVESPR
jgi:hypothetical protein